MMTADIQSLPHEVVAAILAENQDELSIVFARAVCREWRNLFPAKAIAPGLAMWRIIEHGRADLIRKWRRPCGKLIGYLCLALTIGDNECVKALCDSYRPGLTWDDRKDVTHEAIVRDDLATLRWLYENNFEYFIHDSRAAVEYESIACLKFILEQGYYVEKRRLLFFAARGGLVRSFETIACHDNIPMRPDGHYDLVAVMKKYNINPQKDHFVLFAAAYGQLNEIKQHCDKITIWAGKTLGRYAQYNKICTDIIRADPEFRIKSVGYLHKCIYIPPRAEV